MLIEIDFDSEEALYIQLRNQIVLGIATNQYQEGEFTLISLRFPVFFSMMTNFSSSNNIDHVRERISDMRSPKKEPQPINKDKRYSLSRYSFLTNDSIESHSI